MNIHNIAKLCGVSVATVSRVINNSPKVSQKTRDKVLQVIAQEEYTPNVFARGLGLNSMNMVGILCSDVANPFYGLAVSIIERNLRERGYDTLLCCSGTKLENKRKCLQLLLDKRVDAVFLIGSIFLEEADNSHIKEAARQVPVFLINTRLDAPNIYSVYCDEQDAMRMAVKEMVKSGCKDILYINDTDKWSWAGIQKMKGYYKGLGECGLQPRKELIHTVDKTIESAHLCVKSLLNDKVNFSGIVVSEDFLAIGALRAVGEIGADIPIIGFNNSELSTCTTPSITSIDHMLDTLCPLAVEWLEKRLNGEDIPSSFSIGGKLVERDTFKKV